MWHVKAEDIRLKQTSADEAFSVLIGRHESTGGSRMQTVAIVELPPQKKSDSHFHKEREESYFFLAGQGLAYIEEKVAVVKTGDLVFSRPGQRHQFENTSDEPLRYLVFTSPQWVPNDSHS